MAYEIEKIIAMSQKGNRILNYSLNYKLEAIAKKFHVDKKREWRKNKEKLLSARKKNNDAKRKRLDGAGRKPLYQQMEEALVKWIDNQQEKGLWVSQKLIMKKHLFIYNEKANENACEDSVTFIASTEGLQKFICRNGLSLKQKTSVAQKDPSRLIKLVSYILHVKCFATKCD